MLKERHSEILELANARKADTCISEYLDHDQVFYTETYDNTTVIEVVDTDTFDRIVAIERDCNYIFVDSDIDELLELLERNGD